MAITLSIPGSSQSALNKCRLYSAIPPRPPKASVTKTRTRITFLPISWEKLSFTLHDFDVWQWKNESYALVQNRFFSRKELVLEVPGKNQIVIRFHRSRFFLADNGNFRAYGFCSVFFRVSVCRTVNDRFVYATPLQYRISLGRRAVDVNPFAPPSQVF